MQTTNYHNIIYAVAAITGEGDDMSSSVENNSTSIVAANDNHNSSILETTFVDTHLSNVLNHIAKSFNNGYQNELMSSLDKYIVSKQEDITKISSSNGRTGYKSFVRSAQDIDELKRASQCTALSDVWKNEFVDRLEKLGVTAN